MSGLSVGEVFRLADDGSRHRLLWRCRDGGAIFTIDVDARSPMPVSRCAAEVERWLEEGLAERVEDPWARVVVEEALPEAQRARRDKTFEMLRPLLLAQPGVFRGSTRVALTARVEDERGISRFTVYRALRRYWQRGLTPNALLPDHDKCGGRGRTKAASKMKRGRPPLHGPEGLNVTEPVRDTFRAAVQRHYAKNGKLGIEGCYRHCLDEHWSDDAVEPATGRQTRVLQRSYPSLRQFKYWLERDHDPLALERRRRTPRAYDKDSRALLGTSRGEVAGPGDRYQIDATVADVYLVSRCDRSRIVGRPTLYVVVDVHSSMVVGVHVGLEAPSWVGAMSALANAAGDKVVYCKKFGVDIGEADWPCQGLPSAVLADRGEMIGPKADALAKNFGVRVENTPPYRADWKGLVERQFGLLHAAFGPYTPGYVEPDFRERGARDYRLDAALTVDEFTRLIILCVLHHNNHREIRGYNRDAAMIADDVPPIPVEVWEWGRATRGGALRSFPEEHVRLGLLPSEQARVTKEGIVFKGLRYSCQLAIKAGWFERARRKKAWSVDVSYDPRCMDTVHLHDATGLHGFVDCELTALSEAYRDCTLWEIEQVRAEERAARGGRGPAQLQSRIDLDRDIRALTDEAVEKTKAATPKGVSNASRVGGIRENRAAERDAMRKEEAYRSAAAEADPPRAGNVVPIRNERASFEDYEPSIADFVNE